MYIFACIEMGYRFKSLGNAYLVRCLRIAWIAFLYVYHREIPLEKFQQVEELKSTRITILTTEIAIQIHHRSYKELLNLHIL